MPVAPKPTKRVQQTPETDSPAASEAEALRLIHSGGSTASHAGAGASTGQGDQQRSTRKKKLVQLRLEPDLQATVKELAAKDRRSMHFWLVDAVREKIQREQG